MLAKYVSKYKIKIANRYEILADGDRQIINPKDEDFIAAGYKPLIETNPPLFNPLTQVLSPYYELHSDIITKEWCVVDVDLVDEEPTQEDRLEAQVMYTALMTDTLLDLEVDADV